MIVPDSSDSGTYDVCLIAHDSSLSRRLAWRIEELGLTTLRLRFDETSDIAGSIPETAAVIVIDLGWSDQEIRTSMDVLFRITAPDDHFDRRHSVIVLAPWFDPGDRPAWAEAGVRLVVDRTTPPSDIAQAVAKFAGIEIPKD